MKQIVQNYKTGKLSLLEVPVPTTKSDGVLVRNVNSLVSMGTEKQMIDLAKKSLIGKALARPDLAKQVIDKIKTEGLKEAYDQAMSRLDTPLPMGYSSAGEVIAVGSGAEEFRVGDRVACSGSGYASHAEIIFVPKNLCVKIPENVDFESAAFAALGGIALHSTRLAELTLGENVAIIGLGLLGQIAVQVVKASGCSVFGMDIDPEKVASAQGLGMDAGAVIGQDDIVKLVSNFTRGHGTDAVIIMASTLSNEPIQLAGEIAREQGHVIVTGLVGLDVPRKVFYEKELDLKIPRAWGAGMYDEYYERKGVEYPFSYVRWTAQRNMEQFLHLVSQEKVRLDTIITHRFPIDEAIPAYDMLAGKTKEKYIGVLFAYDDSLSLSQKIKLKDKQGTKRSRKAQVNLGIIGAGQFAKGTLLPIVQKLSYVNPKSIATASGMNSKDVGDKFGFEYCTSDYLKILEDSDVTCVMITTRHHLHAKLAVESLKHDKDVFVEKPLALNLSELKALTDVYRDSQRGLMVGFNRRFSPFAIRAKKLLDHSMEPMIINCRVNAGFVSKDSWIQAREEGGGRIIGEICHFIDLIQFFTQSMPVRVYAETISNQSKNYTNTDNIVISIKLENGSSASVVYAANGDKSFPRERIEIFRDESVCLIDNFKSMLFTKGGKRKKMKRFNVDRGHQQELTTFFSCIKDGKQMPVDFTEYVFTTLTTFAIEESINRGIPVDIDTTCLQA